MTVTYKEYAILSNAVYRDENYLDPANYGFEEIDRFSSDEHGTYAVAYKNKDNEVVLAFRGTDNKLNVLHDFQYCNKGTTPPEFEDALQFYKDVKKNCDNGKYGNEKLSLVGMTGHSLGGGMVQYVNAKVAIQGEEQIQGVAFAPLGAGNLFPEGFDASSIKVRNYEIKGDLVPKITRQLGEEPEILPASNQIYEVKYTPNVGNEILQHFDDGKGAKHKMLGYVVAVGHMQTRNCNDAEIAEIIKRENAKLRIDPTGEGFWKDCSPKLFMMQNQGGSVKNTNQSATIDEIINTLTSRMDEINNYQTLINRERNMVKGEPLTKAQTERMAASDYVLGEDKQLDQQASELRIKRDKLNLAEQDNIAYGKEYGFDRTLWRHAPEIFKGEGLKYYESGLRIVKNNNQIFDGQEEKIQAKREQLQEQWQTPEACLAIAKKSAEYLVKDQERLVKLEPLDSKLNDLDREKRNIIELQSVVSTGNWEKEITLQGNVKDIHNILKQSDHIKQQVSEMQQTMALASGQSRGR